MSSLHNQNVANRAIAALETVHKVLKTVDTISKDPVVSAALNKAKQALVGVELNPGPKKTGKSKAPVKATIKAMASIPRSMSNKIVTAPTTESRLTYSTPFRTSGRNSKDGWVVTVSGRHILSSVWTASDTGQPVFANTATTYSVYKATVLLDPNSNGGSATTTSFSPTGSMLSTTALNYAKFRFTKLVLHWIPFVASNQAGEMALAYADDPAAWVSASSSNANYAVLSQMENFVAGPIWMPFDLNVRLKKDKWYYNYSYNDGGDEAAVRQQAQGTILLPTEGGYGFNGGLLGRYEVSYEAEFLSPGMYNSAGVSMRIPADKVEEVKAVISRPKADLPLQNGYVSVDTGPGTVSSTSGTNLTQFYRVNLAK
nr:MAG: putative capsid protein [Permutotetraviridae sp.]